MTKFSTPTPRPLPPAKPLTDAAANGQVAGTPSLKDWIVQDMAYKESQALPVSDGGKGVSN
jgi:hypothetical protein